MQELETKAIILNTKFSLIKQKRLALKNDVILDLLNNLTVVNYSTAKEQVPKTKGIYVWKDNETKKYEYIGIATNKQGLYGRIVSKHLKEDYLEGRETKHSSAKDVYQLKNPIRKKSHPGKKFIDKSAFRKNIGRILKLRPGEETLSYIKGKGKFYFISVKNVEKNHIEAIETILISSYQPKFNISKKNIEIIYADKVLDNYAELKIRLK